MGWHLPMELGLGCGWFGAEVGDEVRVGVERSVSRLQATHGDLFSPRRQQ